MNSRAFSLAAVALTSTCLIALIGYRVWNSSTPDKTIQQPDSHTKSEAHSQVIIVGAGASGLSAAATLEEQGIDYQILEATDRYGGRVKKNQGFADFPIDLGAEWVHQRKEILNTMIGKEPGDEINIELIPYQTLNSYTWEDGEYEQLSSTMLRLSYSMNPEHKFKNTTWFDYLDNNFGQKVKDNIVYNSPVTEIDYSGGQVKLTTKAGEVYTADQVIVTVSVGVLKSNSIEFTPSLPAEKLEAIDHVEFYGGFKLILKFSEKFYPDMIVCDSEIGEKTYYDFAYQKDSKDNVLALLAMGSSAEEYDKLQSEEKIIDAVLQELDTIFDGKASATYTGESLFHDWGNHPYTLGTWTEEFNDKYRAPFNAPLDGKVFFAGETYEDEHWSTVPGAIISGQTVANELLEKIKKE